MSLSPLWRAGAVLYVLINVGGAIYAAYLGEPMHAAGHVGLLVLGMAGALWWRGRRDRDPVRLELPPEVQRLENLQQSVDSIALEVERIGEAQRFTAKLQAQRNDATR